MNRIFLYTFHMSIVRLYLRRRSAGGSGIVVNPASGYVREAGVDVQHQFSRLAIERRDPVTAAYTPVADVARQLAPEQRRRSDHPVEPSRDTLQRPSRMAAALRLRAAGHKQATRDLPAADVRFRSQQTLSSHGLRDRPLLASRTF